MPDPRAILADALTIWAPDRHWGELEFECAEQDCRRVVAALEAVLDLADRVTTEARDFEPINHDGEVAMSTRIHMMGLVRAAVADKLGGTVA